MTAGVSDWELLDEPEVRAGAACVMLGPLVGFCHQLDAGTRTIEGIVVMVTALMAPALTRSSALLLAATGWGAVTGFITHELGELAFGRSDLALMAVLAATSLLAPRRTSRRGSGSAPRRAA